ncbi:MAG: DUF692 family protein [Colwellia sp.]
MKIAAGFNPNFITNTIPLNPDVKLIEIGLTAYNKLFTSQSIEIPSYRNDFSLHIARTPISEKSSIQNDYIARNLSDISTNSRIRSIGYHLSGARNLNIGKYGMTSHYTASKISEKNAISFLKKTQDLTQKDVWLENANFYSETSKSILEAWNSTLYIAEKSNSTLIVDISHIIIDCRNNSLSPEIILGMIPWNKVSEIHLSGIVTGRDGILHDGHSQPINEECWRLFDHLLYNKLIPKDAYINIEHTDSIWSEFTDLYENDFNNLKTKISSDYKLNISMASNKINSYAKGYLKKKLVSSIENLSEVCTNLGFSENEIITNWFSNIDNSTVILALSPEDADKNINSVYFLESFTNFLKEGNHNESWS